MTTVISDSTCLIALERIGRLDILPALFSLVLIPPAVDAEFGLSYEWLRVETFPSSTLSDVLKLTLSKGESEAIVLATRSNFQLITDDKQARSVAEQLGVTVIGTLGLLKQAKDAGLVEELKPIVDDLESNGFRLSKALREEILRVAYE